MIAVDISEMIETCLQDRARCQLAGIPAPHANSEAAAHLMGLANRLRDRIGPRAAMRIAFTFWDSLGAEEGDTTH